MNPTLTVWLQLIGLLAVEGAVIVGIAAQLQRLTRSAMWRRTIWQACILSLLALVVFEFTGAARGLVGWIGKKPASTTPISFTIANSRTLTSQADAHSSPSLPSAGERAGQRRHDPVIIGDNGFERFKRTPLPFARGEGTKDTVITDSMAPSITGQVAPPLQTQVDFQPPSTRYASRNTQPGKLPRIVPATESLSVLWLGLVWMAGAGVVIGRVLVSRIALEIFRWRRGKFEDVDLRESVQTLALRLGIQRRVRLMDSAHIPAPVAFGILRPTVGLPLQFRLKFNSVQQEAMLAHELAHLAGKDPAWYLLADVLAAVLWWHPLIWWSRRQLHAQSEMAADEASLLVADGPGVLAECLVEFGARLAQTRSFIPLGIAGSGYRSGLGRRVERLVKLEGAIWSPPNRIRCGLAWTVGPVALVTAAILCTAWVVPPALTKGENMQTMRQTWKQSLAAFALLTALGPDANQALADTTDAQTAANLTAAKTAEVVAENAANIKPSGPLYSGASSIPLSPGYGEPGENPKPSSGTSGGGSAGQTSSFSTRLVRLSPAPKLSGEQVLLREKLNRITLPSVKYDGLPLTEVINNLVEQSTLRDPDKQGINFVLDREPPALASGPAAIDPSTGLPVPAETIDLSAVSVKIDPAIKNVRLIDILEVLTKTADRPIRYSIEDYGVVFSLDAPKPIEAKSTEAIHEPAIQALLDPMEVMTFKLDTNTFFAGMQSMFGTQYVNDPKVIRSAIGDMFQRLGIIVNARKGFPGFGGGAGDVGGSVNAQNKSFFYNELNGILMVRATRQDLTVVKGIIETLGGVPFVQPGAAIGGGGGSGGGRDPWGNPYNKPDAASGGGSSGGGGTGR